MTTQLAREQLIQKILGDTACCDILISLFASALESHRWNFLLRPFPSSFLLQNPINHDDKKDINSLVTSFEAIPPITLLREKPELIKEMNEKSFQLLSWILNSTHFRISLIDPKTVPEIQSQKIQPDFVVKVDRTTRTTSSLFESSVAEYGSILAFHGSALENFYSIIHNGLTNHLTKPNNLFGEGIYFSKDLSVSIIFAPSGLGWKKSFIGHRISCVAVAQIALHPSVKSKMNPGF